MQRRTDDPAELGLRILADMLDEAARRLRGPAPAAPRSAVPPVDGKVPHLLLTPKEAAEALRISRTAVYELIRDGRLRSMKIGKLRRVPIAALHAYVERAQDDID